MLVPGAALLVAEDHEAQLWSSRTGMNVVSVACCVVLGDVQRAWFSHTATQCRTLKEIRPAMLSPSTIKNANTT